MCAYDEHTPIIRWFLSSDHVPSPRALCISHTHTLTCAHADRTRRSLLHSTLFQIDNAAAVCRCLSQTINYVIALIPYFIRSTEHLKLNANIIINCCVLCLSEGAKERHSQHTTHMTYFSDAIWSRSGVDK